MPERPQPLTQVGTIGSRRGQIVFSVEGPELGSNPSVKLHGEHCRGGALILN